MVHGQPTVLSSFGLSTAIPFNTETRGGGGGGVALVVRLCPISLPTKCSAKTSSSVEGTTTGPFYGQDRESPQLMN